MWFLVTELWPYFLAALAIGIATGWLSGCAPVEAAGGSKPAEEGTP